MTTSTLTLSSFLEMRRQIGLVSDKRLYAAGIYSFICVLLFIAFTGHKPVDQLLVSTLILLVGLFCLLAFMKEVALIDILGDALQMPPIHVDVQAEENLTLTHAIARRLLRLGALQLVLLPLLAIELLFGVPVWMVFFLIGAHLCILVMQLHYMPKTLRFEIRLLCHSRASESAADVAAF